MKFSGIRIKIAQQSRAIPETEMYSKTNAPALIDGIFHPYRKLFSEINSKISELKELYLNHPVSQDQRIKDLETVRSYMNDIEEYSKKSGYDELSQQLLDLHEIIDQPDGEV